MLTAARPEKGNRNGGGYCHWVVERLAESLLLLFSGNCLQLGYKTAADANWKDSRSSGSSDEKPAIKPFLAEGVGFEPTRQVTPPSGFQDRRDRPLCHPSGSNYTVEVRA